MRMSTLVTLLVVGGSGLAAFILSYGYLGQQGDPNKGKVPVLCANLSVKRGDTLELGKNCDFRMVLEAEVPEDAYRQEEKLLVELQQRKYVAVAAIPRNDTIKKSTAGNNPAGLLEAELKNYPGFVAYSIPVSTDRVVAGFIKPGAYVDLLWNGRLKMTKDVSRTLMSNVKVVAVDLENTSGTGTGGKEVRILTLVVSRDDSQRLSYAKTHGEISAALRGGSTDGGKDAGKAPIEVDMSNLFNKTASTSDDDASNEEVAAVEGDAKSLLNVLDAALNSQNTTPIKSVVAAAEAVAKPAADVGSWLVFEVKNLEGKILSRVPVSTKSEFAKHNRRLMREPQPIELDAIRKLGVVPEATL